MDLHLGSQHWKAHRPVWRAAAVAGLIGGATLMVLELLWSATSGASPWIITNQIAGIGLGADIARSADFSASVVAVALVIHYALGVVFGCILAAMLSLLHLEDRPGMEVAAGAVFGTLLYIVGFYGMASLYPWFADLRGLETYIGQVIFGMVVAFTYWKLTEDNNAHTGV